MPNMWNHHINEAWLLYIASGLHYEPPEHIEDVYLLSSHQFCGQLGFIFELAMLYFPLNFIIQYYDKWLNTNTKCK